MGTGRTHRNFVMMFLGWLLDMWSGHKGRVAQGRAYRQERDERRRAGKRDKSYMGYPPTATLLRRWLYKHRGIYWSAQNLNTHGRGNQEVIVGSAARKGRGWLHFGMTEQEEERRDIANTRARNAGQKPPYKLDGKRKTVGTEWVFGDWKPHFSISFDMGGDDDHDCMFHIALPGVSLYIYLEDFFPRSWYIKPWDALEKGLPHTGWVPAGSTRSTGVRFHDGLFTAEWWHDDTGWTDRKHNGPHISFFVLDKLLGRTDFSRQTLSEEQVEISMPEGTYPATVKIERCEWKRARWPWPRVMVGASVEMQKPVPFPGKGENGWDMDDDAMYSMSGPYSTVSEAVGAVVQSVLRDRERYGGIDWQPVVAG